MERQEAVLWCVVVRYGLLYLDPHHVRAVFVPSCQPSSKRACSSTVHVSYQHAARVGIILHEQSEA